MKKLVIGTLIAGAVAFGLYAGTGPADARIEPGHYKSQSTTFGIFPSPQSNVRVIGNKMYSDYFGTGPWNLYEYQIQPTKNGGVASRAGTREVYNKTRDGYRGPVFAGAIPFADGYLKKVKPRR